MDLLALRVFNSLYKLGIAEAEFDSLGREQTELGHSGLYVECVKKGFCVGVCHEELGLDRKTHEIFVKKLKESAIEIKPKSRIMFKTLITFTDLPSEVYVLHTIGGYQSMDSEVKFEARNLEELKNRICDRFVDKYPKTLGECVRERYGYSDREAYRLEKDSYAKEQLKAIYWLFGKPYAETKIKSRQNVARIVAVFTRNNRRLAVIREDKFEVHNGGGYSSYVPYEESYVNWKIQVFTPRQKQYDFVDVGREIYENDIWISDELADKVSIEELEVLNQRSGYGGQDIFLTPDYYTKVQRAVKLEILNARRKSVEGEAKKKLVEGIKKNFDYKGEVMRQGIRFTKNSVEYEGLYFKGDDMMEYFSQRNTLYLEQPDFTQIFHDYIDFILQPDTTSDYSSEKITLLGFDGFKENPKMKFEINGISIRAEKKGNVLYVNDRKIVKEDLIEVCRRSLSFRKQEEFDEFVLSASRVNLNLQKCLVEGKLTFIIGGMRETADNDLCSSKDMLFVIPIMREQGKNYITINNKRYRVKNINALFELNHRVDSNHVDRVGGYVVRTIRYLSRALEAITPQDIGEIITQGEREYVKAEAGEAKRQKAIISKSKEFLKHAVALTKAQKTRGGWLVRGLSGKLYFVSDKNVRNKNGHIEENVRDSGAVYAVKDDGKIGQYICIVDVWNREEAEVHEARENDRIAKRLLMLSKDLKVSSEVYTLRNYLTTGQADEFADEEDEMEVEA